MDKGNKTSLQEAMANFEEIKKYATNSAKKEMEKQLSEKVDKILKESISIDIDDNGDLTIEKDDKVVEMEKNEEGNTEVEVETTSDHEQEKDEQEPLENIEEMVQNEEEQTNVPQAQNNTAEPIDSPEQVEQQPIDVDDEPIEIGEEPEQIDDNQDVVDSLSQKLADNIMDLVKAAIKDQNIGVENQETEVVIDDEVEQTQPEGQPIDNNQPVQSEQPIQSQQEQPQQEQPIQEEDGDGDEEFEIDFKDEGNKDEIFEISLSELENENFSDDNEEFEIDFEDGGIDSSMENYDKEEQEQELLTNEPEIEIEDEMEIDEMKGKSKPLTQKQNSLSKLPRMEESIKTQYESKIDGLKKENNSLNETVKELNTTIKEYKDSFIELRKQFNEMQNFNAKLAYANKIFIGGGLSTEDKITIAEQFDQVKDSKEALNLYNKIIKENKVSINENSQKIKSQSTKVVKPKNETFYESKEMKRRKQLAGIEKNGDLYS